MITLDKDYVKSKLKIRNKDAHKGNFGTILIYAGSVGMAGAAILCGRAALKSGAGLVRFLLPSGDDKLLGILQVSVPEATCVFYKEGMDFNAYSAIAAGPGLGTEEGARYILRDILETYGGNLVLDADALNMIAMDERLSLLLKLRSGQTTITPHIGEARRLLANDGQDPLSITIKSQEERELAHKQLSHRYNCIAVLKGAGSLVGDSANQFINTTGNPGMATGGSGDVLTGIIASLAGQGYDMIDAACIGTYVHGLAGDLAANAIGQVGMISSDIAAFVPYAFKSLQ